MITVNPTTCAFAPVCTGPAINVDSGLVGRKLWFCEFSLSELFFDVFFFFCAVAIVNGIAYVSHILQDRLFTVPNFEQSDCAATFQTIPNCQPNGGNAKIDNGTFLF